MFGKGPKFYYEDSDSGEMAGHFDSSGREGVKDYSEFKNPHRKTPIIAMEMV
jgi:hypothetical protein